MCYYIVQTHAYLLQGRSHRRIIYMPVGCSQNRANNFDFCAHITAFLRYNQPAVPPPPAHPEDGPVYLYYEWASPLVPSLAELERRKLYSHLRLLHAIPTDFFTGPESAAINPLYRFVSDRDPARNTTPAYPLPDELASWPRPDTAASSIPIRHLTDPDLPDPDLADPDSGPPVPIGRTQSEPGREPSPSRPVRHRAATVAGSEGRLPTSRRPILNLARPAPPDWAWPKLGVLLPLKEETAYGTGFNYGFGEGFRNYVVAHGRPDRNLAGRPPSKPERKRLDPAGNFEGEDVLYFWSGVRHGNEWGAAGARQLCEHEHEPGPHKEWAWTKRAAKPGGPVSQLRPDEPGEAGRRAVGDLSWMMPTAEQLGFRVPGEGKSRYPIERVNDGSAQTGSRELDEQLMQGLAQGLGDLSVGHDGREREKGADRDRARAGERPGLSPRGDGRT